MDRLAIRMATSFIFLESLHFCSAHNQGTIDRDAGLAGIES